MINLNFYIKIKSDLSFIIFTYKSNYYYYFKINVNAKDLR